MPSSHKLAKIATLTLLASSLAVVLMQPSVEAVRTALVTLVISFIMVGHVFLPEGPIGGPLSFLWKTIAGVSLFYFCSLAFFLPLSKETAMSLLGTYVDPTLKFMNYEQVSYGQNCDLIARAPAHPLSNLYHSSFDLFALAHFLGWFFKTLICRDLKLVLFASVTFEMIEYSLRNVLNNFKECWWDHVILDICGCNLLGIAVGFYVIDKFGLDRYRWSLRSAPLQHTHWEHFVEFWRKWDVSHMETKVFTSLRPFLKFVFFFIIFQATDLTLFFLKYIYQVPPSHFLCVSRVWIVGLLCVNAAKQYYDFLKHRAKFRKVNILLLFGIVVLELAIVLTQGQNDFDHMFIDELGQLMLGGLLALVVVMTVKIGISDILRKLRGFKEKRRMMQEREIEKQFAKRFVQ